MAANPIFKLSTELKNACRPQTIDGLQLENVVDLTARDLDDDDAFMIAITLSSGKCADNLHFDLSSNYFTNIGLSYILEALQSPNCPSNIELNLCSNDYGDHGLMHIAQFISSEKYPNNITININDFDITEKGLNAIKTSIDNCKNIIPIKITSDPAIDIQTLIQEKNFALAEIRRAARILAQADRMSTTEKEPSVRASKDKRTKTTHTRSTPILTLPTEILTKICSHTAQVKPLSDKIANKIACHNFERPMPRNNP